MAGYYTYNGGLIGTGQIIESVGVHSLTRNLLTPPGALYPFSTHTFTTAGNDTSRDGPLLSEAQTSYSTQTWASDTNFFNVYLGVQLWKVPLTASYDITAAGARGGAGINGTSYSSSSGSGRIVSGRVSLQMGDVIAIIVGAIGNERGGGGGSFVWYWGNPISSGPGTQNLIIAAGGGGGGGGIPVPGNYADAPQTESAVPWFATTPTTYNTFNSPPTPGYSGEQRDNTGNYWDGCPGAGWNESGVVQQPTNNTPAAYYTTWGETSGTYISTIMGAQSPKSSTAPGRGGIAWYVNAGGNPDGSGAGGFGGGGTMGGDNGSANGTGGGGGGYSGGCQGGNAVSGTYGRAQGGGAGSYLTSSPYLVNKTWGGTNSAAGYVTITKV